MDDITLYKKIEDTLYKSDDKFRNLIKLIYKELKKKSNTEYVDDILFTTMCKLFFEKLNLNDTDLVSFYIRATSIKFKNSKLDYFTDILQYVFREYSIKNKERFLEVLKDDEIQEKYSNWFKMYRQRGIYNSDIFEEIFDLPKFKEIVLKDTNYVIEMSIDRSFFKFIPKDLCYLIGFNSYDNFLEDELYNLYKKNFGDVLDEEQLKELTSLNLKINSKYNIVLQNKINLKKEFVLFLKYVNENPNYYNIIKNLHKKLNLDFITVIRFSSKYNNTKLFYNLCTNLRDIDDSLSKKIKLLGILEKIINIDDIDNLNDISLNELVSKDKENVNTELMHSPTSFSYYLGFSLGSNSREIRRIDMDGSFQILPILNMSHQQGVDTIYKGIKLLNKKNTALEKAIEAAKKISSITFIIENEACFIVIPSDINDKQIEICLKWISSSYEEAKIGIIKYNKETNKNEIVADNNLTKEEIIEYVSNLNVNIQKKGIL